MNKVPVVLTILFLCETAMILPVYSQSSVPSPKTQVENQPYSTARDNNATSTTMVIPTNQYFPHTKVTVSNITNGTAPFRPLLKYDAAFSHVKVAHSNGTISNPIITGSSRNVYIVYSDNQSGKTDVFVAVSRDFGKTYDSPVNLSANLTGNSSNYHIGAAEDFAL
jgi:hypothetical protein